MSDYFQQTRSEMLPFLPEKFTRSLEIGCGEGSFSAGLTDEAEKWGIEPDETAAKKAGEKLTKVFAKTYEEAHADLPDEHFDLIVCNDVIEHLVDHDVFLQSIQKKMAPGGCLVASVPNVRYYTNIRKMIFQKDWKYEDAGILDRTHLRFFTYKSLKRSLDACGMKIERLEGINTPGRIKLFIIFFNLLMLGTQSDIKYMQYAFRLKK